MTFVEILKADHAKVKDLFSKIESGGGFKEKILTQIEEELKLHMELEEKFLYPALEKKETEVKEKTLEGYEEHHVTKMVIKELGKVSPSDERWKAKVTVLQELVEHHIEEEESKLFKMAKKALDKNEIQQITEKIQQGKQQAGKAA